MIRITYVVESTNASEICLDPKIFLRMNEDYTLKRFKSDGEYLLIELEEFTGKFFDVGCFDFIPT